MKFFKVTNLSKDYINLILKEQSNDNHQYLKDKFVGQRIGGNWIPVDVITFNKGKKKMCDAFKFWDSIGSLVLSKRAIESLKDLLEDNTEILPLNHPDIELYGVNVLNIVDALDEEKSSISRFPDGTIMLIDKPIFKTNIGIHHIFKIPQASKLEPFVSEHFVNRVQQEKLKGFIFEEVRFSDNLKSNDKVILGLNHVPKKDKQRENSDGSVTVKVTFNISQSDIVNLHQALSSYMDKNQHELIESCWPFINTATFITKTSCTDEALAVVSEYVLKFVNELLNNEPNDWRENYLSCGGKELSLVNIAAIVIG